MAKSALLQGGASFDGRDDARRHFNQLATSGGG